MSSNEQTRDQQVKIKLMHLSDAIHQVVTSELESFSDAEINHALQMYSKYLSYNLNTDFTAVRTTRLKQSPFDSILGDTQ